MPLSRMHKFFRNGLISVSYSFSRNWISAFGNTSTITHRRLPFPMSVYSLPKKTAFVGSSNRKARDVASVWKRQCTLGVASIPLSWRLCHIGNSGCFMTSSNIVQFHLTQNHLSEVVYFEIADAINSIQLVHFCWWTEAGDRLNDWICDIDIEWYRFYCVLFRIQWQRHVQLYWPLL